MVMQTILYLKGLGCADCAQKIASMSEKLSGVTKARVDFVTQKLTIELTDENERASVIKQIKSIVASVEPSVVVSENKDTDEGHDHDHDGRSTFANIIMVAGAVIFFTAMFTEVFGDFKVWMFLLAYVLIGYDVLLRAAGNILHGQIFDENFLMSIATIGAIAIKEYPEAVAVMLFYQVGEYFQHKAVDQARGSIASLMDIRPDFANLVTNEGLKKVSPDEVRVGDSIAVKPGEKIPLDGIVTEGFASLDTAALTGESLPYDVSPGSKVLSGAINKSGFLTVKVEKEFGESTVQKILDMVENASAKKAPTERFITRFARYYTPAVVFAAVLIAFVPTMILPDAVFSDWVHRALVFLVVSCPCALVISVPLSFFGGIGSASKKGILIKGGNYLEALNAVDTIVFDKTGTLTKGSFAVSGVLPTEGVDKKHLLKQAAYAENLSNHPIALSVQKAYMEKIDASVISDYQEIAGHGIKAKVNGIAVLAGNARLMEEAGITLPDVDSNATVIHVAENGQYLGYLTIEDQIKEDSHLAIEKLKAIGVKNIAMFTGDNASAARKIAEKTGISQVYAGLLPGDKVDLLEKMHAETESKGSLVFVGDGINDAPVLARADVGIAMGALGSDAAIEAADVVIMTDEPSKIATAVKIARKTRKIVWQNIAFALSVKFVVLFLGAIGIAGMWMAVFSDVGVALLAVINAMRTLAVD